MRRKHLASLFAALAFVGAAGCTDDRPDLSGQTTRRTTALRQYDSCSALITDLRSVLKADADTRIEQRDIGWSVGVDSDSAGAPNAGAEGDSGGATRTEGEDYSGTNNQEDGVDEADIVKTDGFHVYALNGNRLHILGVPEFGQIAPESTTEIEGIPTQLLVHKDANRAVVFSQVYPWTLPEDHPVRAIIGETTEEGYWYARVTDLTKITVLDITDRGEPELLREVFVEGWYQTARMVNGSVRIGAYGWTQVPELDNLIWGGGQGLGKDASRTAAHAFIDKLELEDLIPRMYERLPSGDINTVALTQDDCHSYYRPYNSSARGIASIYSLDLLGDSLAIDADHVVANYPIFYASKETLYLAESAWDWWWFWWNQKNDDVTNIHAFDISQAGQTNYVGSGRVDGTVLNQFALSEHEGVLRVATTTERFNRWWDGQDGDEPEPTKNHIFTLGLDPVVVVDDSGSAFQTNGLRELGHVGDIAPGERIFAARFQGDKGYIVTFENVDPLFTIDLSNPAAPRIVGELKIPGFSTYLHPIAGEKLLAIGVGGDDNGANWRTQISMFDVSDFEKPTQLDVEELVPENGWGWSEAQYEHKAFQYWAPKGLLAIPLSASTYAGTENWSYTSKLEFIKVDAESGALSRYGSIDHSSYFQTDQYWYFTDVRRSIFMGDFVYAISDRAITVHKVSDLSKVDEITLPGYTDGQYYWWY